MAKVERSTPVQTEQACDGLYAAADDDNPKESSL
jgi:hypothetical protein